MTPIRTSLQDRLPRHPADDAHIRAMAGAAWHQRGWVCLPLDEIDNDWVRAAVAGIMARRFGKRRVG